MEPEIDVSSSNLGYRTVLWTHNNIWYHRYLLGYSTALNYEFVLKGRVIIRVRGATPTLRGYKVGFSSPRTVPTQAKCKTPHQKRQGIAWDAYDTANEPQNSNYEIVITHDQLRRPQTWPAWQTKHTGREGDHRYTTHMCHRHCRWCSASALRPAWPVTIRHNASSTQLINIITIIFLVPTM